MVAHICGARCSARGSYLTDLLSRSDRSASEVISAEPSSVFSTENSQIVAYSPPSESPQVLSGEMRFSPDKAYPEKFGAEAPEQPQNTARVKKVGFFPSAPAPAAGAKHGGRNQTAAGQLAEYRITAQALVHC